MERSAIAANGTPGRARNISASCRSRGCGIVRSHMAGWALRIACGIITDRSEGNDWDRRGHRSSACRPRRHATGSPKVPGNLIKPSIRPQRQVDRNRQLTPVDDRVGAPSSVPTSSHGTTRLSALNSRDLGGSREKGQGLHHALGGSAFDGGKKRVREARVQPCDTTVCPYRSGAHRYKC